MRCTAAVMAVGLALAITATAGATSTSLSMDIRGTINSEHSYAGVGDWMQVGPLGPNGGFAWGEVLSYSASSDLPQVGEDLDKYGWAMEGTIDTVDWDSGTGTGTVTYSGDWWINYLGSGSGTYDYQTKAWALETGTFTMTANFDSGTTAEVTGHVIPSASYNFTWPEGHAEGTTVDWSSAGSGWLLNGQFDTNELTGTVVVPEPLTMAGVLAGVAGIGAYLRKRRMA